MKFRVLYKEDDKEKMVDLEVAVNLKTVFGPEQAAKKIGIPAATIIRITRVS